MVNIHFAAVTNFQKEHRLTKQDDNDWVLYVDHFFTTNAARVVAAELVKHWIWSNVYSIHELTVAKKIFNKMAERRFST